MGTVLFCMASINKKKARRVFLWHFIWQNGIFGVYLQTKTKTKTTITYIFNNKCL